MEHASTQVDRSRPAMTPVFRAEVVGSLLRPPELKKAAIEYETGALSADGYARVQSDAVADALRLQAECGLDVCTDGELRRRHFLDPLLRGLSGLRKVPISQHEWHDRPNHEQDPGGAEAVTAKLEFSGSDEPVFYRQAASAAPLPLKVTLPSPTCLLSRWVPGVSSEPYPDPFEMFDDTAAILRGLVGELVDAGCRYMQFDAPELTTVVDPSLSSTLARQGIDPDRLIDTACDLLNSITEGIADDVKFALHLCRGNRRGLWRRRGGYGALAVSLFPRLTDIDTFMLEFDDDRSGSFECLSQLPTGRIAVLGLITTKHGTLEPRESVIARLHEAAGYAPLEQLALSTQCGFASTAEGNPITAEQQRQKLTLVAEIARDVWPASSAAAGS